MKTKKPLAVILTAIYLALMSILAVWITAHGFIAPIPLIRMTITVVALIGLLVRCRSLATYCLTLVALAFWAAASIDTAFTFPNGAAPPHGLPRSGMLAHAIIICLLLWRFSLGRPSRTFYGFVERDEANAV